MIKAIQKTGKQLHLNDLGDVTALSQTGRHSTFDSLGIESYYKNVFLGVNYQKPINQDLSGGELKTNARLNVHFTILI